MSSVIGDDRYYACVVYIVRYTVNGTVKLVVVVSIIHTSSSDKAVGTYDQDICLVHQTLLLLCELRCDIQEVDNIIYLHAIRLNTPSLADT